MKSLQQLQAVIHYQFTDEQLLQTAITHRSFSKKRNNETLEFLGDSVLGLVISEHLYKRLSKASEGELSRIRASLVKEDALATVARDPGHRSVAFDLERKTGLAGGISRS